jgi:hypothetical protein
MYDIYESDIALVIDQLANNEVSDDNEMIAFLDEHTSIPRNTIKAIVSNERTKFLCDPFRTEDEIDWHHYNINII